MLHVYNLDFISFVAGAVDCMLRVQSVFIMMFTYLSFVCMLEYQSYLWTK